MRIILPLLMVGPLLVGCETETLQFGHVDDPSSAAAGQWIAPAACGADLGAGGDGGGVDRVLSPEAAARWIAFDSDREAYNRDLYLVRADGSEMIRLTTDGSTDREPAFSHDGYSLAFVSDRTGEMQIHVMDPLTGQVSQLTSMPGGADQPSWSCADDKIAFHSGASVYLMDADGSNPQLIGTGLDTFNAYKYPTLSHDGTEILCDRNNEINAIKIDGSGQRYVVQNSTTEELAPALSPDGVNVAFSVGCATVPQIAVAPFAGPASDPCGVPRLTPESSGSARRPAWGPSGVLAYERGPGPNPSLSMTSIALLVAAGDEPYDLVGPPGDNRNPAWAPAGFQPP